MRDLQYLASVTLFLASVSYKSIQFPHTSSDRRLIRNEFSCMKGKASTTVCSILETMWRSRLISTPRGLSILPQEPLFKKEIWASYKLFQSVVLLSALLTLFQLFSVCSLRRLGPLRSILSTDGPTKSLSNEAVSIKHYRYGTFRMGPCVQCSLDISFSEAWSCELCCS